MDLTISHPSFESRDTASPRSATLSTASPVTFAAIMQGAARPDSRQFMRRWAAPAAAIVALHIAAGIAVLRLVDRPPVPAVAARELTVSLIAPPAAPVAVPVAAPEPKPVPKPTPKPVVKHTVTPRPPIVPPSQVLATQAPSQTTVAAPPAAPTTPPAPSEAAADAAAAPSAAPSRASSGAPISVAHLTCDGDPPAYPMLSKRRGEAGTVIVAITVDTHGVVRSATLRQSSGFPRLDEAALEAARERSCQPYVENGTPVAATALLPFAFHLEG